MNLKDSYMSLAEQMARDIYRQDFYDLPENIQKDIYNEAMETVIEEVIGSKEIG